MEHTPNKTEVSPSIKPKPNLKIEMPKIRFSNRTLWLGFFTLIILGSAYGYRSFLIAATIDGSPVSRLAVIRELEAQGGKAALDAIITERLVTAEANKANISATAAEIDAEIEKASAGIAAQGMTLEGALAAQGLTLEDVRQQIAARKKLEKLLGDTILVTDADIDAYLVETKIVAPKTMSEEEFRGKVREQLANQKFGKEADAWIAEARKKANIHYLVDYAKETEPTPTPDTTTP